MKLVLLGVLTLALVPVWAKGADEGKARVLKIATSTPDTEGDVNNKGAKDFKRLLEERLPGVFEIVIFPGGQLGSEQSTVEDVQAGVIDMSVVASNNVINTAPSLGLYDFPYLFDRQQYAC